MGNRDYTVYVRDTLDDTGEVPNPSSYIWHSPDIILWHQQFTQPQAQAEFGTSASYQTFPGRNLYPSSTQNYIYVRMKNTQAASANVTLHLWELPSNLINYPGTWNDNNLILNASVTADGTSVTSNGITVASGVNLAPTNGSGSDHFCYIAEIIPPGKSALLPDMSQNYWDWVSAIANSNTLAQCNCYLVAPNLTTITVDKYSMTNTRVFATTPTSPNLEIQLDCSKLPLNCAVSVWTPNITDPSQNGYLDNREYPFVVSNSQKYASFPVTAPSAPASGETWSTPITIQWTYPDGVSSSVNDKIIMSEAYIVDQASHEEARMLGVTLPFDVDEVVTLGSAIIQVSDNA